MDERTRTTLAERIRFHTLLLPSPSTSSNDPTTLFTRSNKQPGIFVQLDAVYNVSRHLYGGLAVERSPGFFTFFDCEGLATPYVGWRRTESHAFTPFPLSLFTGGSVDLQSLDGTNRPLAPDIDVHVEDELLHTNRFHSAGSDQVKDWLAFLRQWATLGVDLVVSLDPEQTPAQAVGQVITASLKQGGDAVVPWSTWTAFSVQQRKAWAFRRVDRFNGLAVCLDRGSAFAGEQGFDKVETAVFRGVGGEPQFDGLKRWIACRV